VFVIIGLVVVFGSVIGGYVMHHGNVAVLWQPTEFIIIGGAGVGTLVVANPPAVLKACMSQLLGLLKPNPYGAKAYAELLQVLYEVFQKARKDGLVGLESHIENITMGSIGGAASEIGNKVAAALVGTFIGILLAYGVFGPIAKAMETRLHAEHDYMLCIRTALLSFARGDAPMTAVEFSRRNIEPHERPSFAELEELTRKKAA